MLWLALVFPDLALECLPGLAESSTAWVLTRHHRVMACNLSARARGIQPGHSLSAAYALEPDLQHRGQDAHAQHEALVALADWALGLSAEVSLEGDEALLMEIGSTRRYLGGLDAIRDRVRGGLAERGHVYQDGIAPTPLAAWWLARAAPGSVIDEQVDLPAGLARLPLTCLGLPDAVCTALHGAGVERVEQLLVLPRAALARRHGPAVPQLLDRALGHQPDPRICIQPRQVYRRSIALAYPVHELARLMVVIGRMVPDLIDWSWRHAQVLTRIVLILTHEDHPATRLEIGFTGTRNPRHLCLVIEETLERQQLKAPVTVLELEIQASQDALEPGGDLLPAPPSRLREGQELLERLRARLGQEAVQGLSLRADHRPELAWQFSEPGSAPPLAPWLRTTAPRPLWLLERPRDLGSESLPRLGGPLQLLAGPERIESGWWDGQDVARDYFVASGPDGPQYWVYRERRGLARWFLQGVFA